MPSSVFKIVLLCADFSKLSKSSYKSSNLSVVAKPLATALKKSGPPFSSITGDW